VFNTWLKKEKKMKPENEPIEQFGNIKAAFMP